MPSTPASTPRISPLVFGSVGKDDQLSRCTQDHPGSSPESPGHLGNPTYRCVPSPFSTKSP